MAISAASSWGGAVLAALMGGQREDVHPAIRSGDREAAGFKHDVRDGGLERFRGSLLTLVDDARGRHEDRLAFGIEAARAAGAAADRDRVGVTLLDADLLAIDAELVDHQLDVGRLVTLAGALGAHVDIDEAVIGEADLGALGIRATGRLEVIGRTNAALETTLLACRAAGREPGPIHLVHRVIQNAVELAAIVGLVHCGDVRHRSGIGPCSASGVRSGPSRSHKRRYRSAVRRGSCSRGARHRDRHPRARYW